MAAAQPHARIVDVDGQELVYRQWGAASAQPLLYWPGLNPFSDRGMKAPTRATAAKRKSSPFRTEAAPEATGLSTQG
jgi:hypothetical protein